MTYDSWQTLELIFGSASGLFSICAASFAIMNEGDLEKQNLKRRRLLNAWKIIREINLKDIPRSIISKFVRLIESAPTWALVKYESGVQADWGFVLVFASLPFACYYKWGIAGVIAAIVLSIPVLLYPFIEEKLKVKWGILGFLSHPGKVVLGCLATAYTGLVITGTSILWLILLLQINIYAALFATILLVPIFTWTFTGVAESLFPENAQNYAALFGLSISISLFTTFLAFVIGHSATPELWIPRTPKMIIVNALFDGFTVQTTYILLRWLTRRSKRNIFIIPIVVTADFLIAAVFASSSLYLGLPLDGSQLTIEETINILIAHNPNGAHWEIGPYFWVMHTTFIPTALYLLMIAITWMARLLLISIESILGKMWPIERPLKMTSLMCTLLAAISGAIAFACNQAEAVLSAFNL